MVDALFPAHSSSFPISYTEYMHGIMQATNDEVVRFLKDNAMYVVDPTFLNRAESSFIRVPPNPFVKDYDIVRFDALADTLNSYMSTGQNELFIGWEDVVAQQEANALLNFLEDKPGDSIFNTVWSWRPSPSVKFIGDNVIVIECLNSTQLSGDDDDSIERAKKFIESCYEEIRM
ncbi:hypothetical protein ACH5RR_036189 [Cinchona calisaya]|uniref:Uncharacterized protein n=1 Tax=Cinchona calisaya TaxID=153742 RepID=A0ABD2Y4H6_9GENT